MKSSKHQLDETFFVAGVNYRTAPVEVRERMVVAEAELASAQETLRILKVGPTLSEIEIQSSMVKEASRVMI